MRVAPALSFGICLVGFATTASFPSDAAPGPQARSIPPAASAASAMPAAGTTVTSDAPNAPRGQLSVVVDRAKVIRLPENTKTVVVGNPAIADVAIQKNGIVVMTGKSYGVTNLLALDGAGNMLAESTLSVQAPNDAVIVVQRGLERQSYSCTPSCQPSVILGDASTYFNDTKTQADQHSQFATQR